jgi:hypothetical protein
MTSSGLSKYPPSVGIWNAKTSTLEAASADATGGPNAAAGEESDRRLNICVIFTSLESTVSALMSAGGLAKSLGARITLLALQVVPFPRPLDSPPVRLDWNEARFQAIAEQSPVETAVRLYLCRDSVQTLKDALGSKSVVVIGGGGSRWPFTAERRLSRELRRAGHEVILI